jgi:xanthine dehydrogenase YagS FAD-binding subunit
VIEYRAGGTDLQQRLRSGVSQARVVDLRGKPALSGIAWGAHGGARIGALTRIETLAADRDIQRCYPALAAAAAALATPQIRAMATVGGNLLQRNRCWYFRNPAFRCFKKGGDTCPARHGNHLFGVCFDLGPCVWPHPSTLGAALLLYDAHFETISADARPIESLYGSGRDGGSDHLLAAGEVLTAVVLPAPVEGERGAYRRAISRASAEWPLAEAVVRLVLDREGIIRCAGVAVGGVAPVPLRRGAAEQALVGRSAGPGTLEAAAAAAADGARPLPMTHYKTALLAATVLDALQLACP